MKYRGILQSLFSTKPGQTPQTVPLQGQVANNAGGHYYAVDDWARLDRFLILGTNDPLSFGVAGFDAAAPQLVSSFIKGDV